MASEAKKQNVRLIYQIAAFVAFLLLGYLGLRGYKNSVEKLKINTCVEQIGELVKNIQNVYSREFSYKDFDYNKAVALRVIPKSLFPEGYKEAVHAYHGGVDVYYSSYLAIDDNKAFEVSFEGLSSMACKALARSPWVDMNSNSLIAVGAYPSLTPSGVLDEILLSTPSSEIKSRNQFKGSDVRTIPESKLDLACKCPKDTCSVIWKFR